MSLRKLHEPGDTLGGFRVVRATAIDTLRSVAYELEHVKTGARLLHLHNETDDENLFSVAFRTPPADSTGLPHIMEHSVLGGSEKYPVKEPFVELLKMSMATFVNAMTFPDRTVYPVASNVKKDYWNLADVYFDACFHPLISENTLRQEGHHLDFAKPGDTRSDLVIKGIVYNEMKGAYSAPEMLVRRHSSQELFPDTPYGQDSGGDPEVIPELTYEDFKLFFDTYYHPSNAFFFIYGDIPTVEHCRFLDRNLDGYGRIDIDAAINIQPRWKKPVTTEHKYPVGKNDDVKNKTFLSLGWLIGSGVDVGEVLAMTVLDKILLSGPAAPLRKALIGADICDDLFFSGYADGSLETTFHVAVKGSDRSKKDLFEKTIFDTLTQLAENGIPADDVEAALRQVEYDFLEIPDELPLWLMEKTFRTWLYAADPLIFLDGDRHLAELRANCRANPALFTDLIREKLLANPHRLLVVCEPDPEYAEEKRAAFDAKMKKLKAALAPDDLAKIERAARELDELQSRPNDPQAVAALPQLGLGDVPKTPVEIPHETDRLDNGAPFIRCDVFANGIGYVDASFNLDGLAPDLYPYLRLFTASVSRLGAAGRDYVEMAKRIKANTGGISAAVDFGYHSTADRVTQSLALGGKALDRTFDEFLAILRDVIFGLDFGDRTRLREVVNELKAKVHGEMGFAGHNIAGLWAARGMSVVGSLNNLCHGVPQFRLLTDIGANFDKRCDALVENLKRIQTFLQNRERLCVVMTGTPEIAQKTKDAFNAMLAKMKKAPIANGSGDFTPLPPAREGLAFPTQVSYCVRTLPSVSADDPDATLLEVFNQIVRFSYLWEEVRAKGGAYGCPSFYSPAGRRFFVGSYRDPFIGRTYGVYDNLANYVRDVKWSADDVIRAAISTAKQSNRPIRPSDASGNVLRHILFGEDAAYRRRKRERVLAATAETIRAAALRQFADRAGDVRDCVFAGRESIAAENKTLDKPFTIEDVLKGVSK